MDLPIDVLPTPGGPTNSKIAPLKSFLYSPTAKNSSMRSLTSLSPS